MEPTEPLAQSVRRLSFEAWCANHEDAHRARWCRELYPWEVFAQGDYRDEALNKLQRVGAYELTVLNKVPGKIAGRTELCVRLETAGTSKTMTWKNGRWADEFVLVAANDGSFITLFTRREDPAKHALIDFMSGKFARLSAERCLAWSALLFRSLILELATPLGPWERNSAFPIESPPARTGHRQHSEYRPQGDFAAPFLSDGRRRWLMYGFSEEKAHRQALLYEGQCEQLYSVYCHPTLTQHHRSRSPGTRVMSLFELARLARLPGGFIPQIRFLTNHMRMVGADAPFSQPLDEAIAALDGATSPQAIATSELREARAALGMEVKTFGDAAYAFAAANLLNAALNPKAGYYNGALRIPKDAYSFKQRVGVWVDGLVVDPIEGVTIYVESNGPVYVRVGSVQFSFHAVPRSPILKQYSRSPQNKAQAWSGRKLQPISPTVLAWGRAVFAGESLGSAAPDADVG